MLADKFVEKWAIVGAIWAGVIFFSYYLIDLIYPGNSMSGMAGEIFLLAFAAAIVAGYFLGALGGWTFEKWKENLEDKNH